MGTDRGERGVSAIAERRFRGRFAGYVGDGGVWRDFGFGRTAGIVEDLGSEEFGTVESLLSARFVVQMKQGFPDLHAALNEPMKAVPIGNGVIHAMKHVAEIDAFMIVKAENSKGEANPYYKSSTN